MRYLMPDLLLLTTLLYGRKQRHASSVRGLFVSIYHFPPMFSCLMHLYSRQVLPYRQFPKVFCRHTVLFADFLSFFGLLHSVKPSKQLLYNRKANSYLPPHRNLSCKYHCHTTQHRPYYTNKRLFPLL